MCVGAIVSIVYTFIHSSRQFWWNLVQEMWQRLFMMIDERSCIDGLDMKIKSNSN